MADTKGFHVTLFCNVGMAALCMAVLVDRGLLDYDGTVASYWPEFAQNGKENVTVRMLLNHEVRRILSTDR